MSDEKVWYYSVEGESIGPVSLNDLRALAARGELDERDHVFRDGWDDWTQAQDIAEIWAVHEDDAGDAIAESDYGADDEVMIFEYPEGVDIRPRPEEPGDIEVIEMPTATRGQQLAIGSFIAAISSILICPFAFPIAIVLGYMALKELKANPDDTLSRVFAWIGLGIGSLFVIVVLLVVLLLIFGVAVSG